jgi:Tfp pilus assembly protein PilO
MNYNQIKKSIFVLLIFALLAVVFLFFAFGFVTVKSASVQKLDKKVEELKVSRKNFQILKQEHTEWMSIRSKYGEIKKDYFLSLGKLTKFKAELNRFLGESSARVLKKEFSNTDIRNEFLKMSISLIFETSYKKVKEFVFKINQKHKIIVFKSLDIKKKEETCYCEAVLEVYFVR